MDIGHGWTWTEYIIGLDRHGQLKCCPRKTLPECTQAHNHQKEKCFILKRRGGLF